MMMNEKIRIRLKAYDYRILDQRTSEIVDTATRTGARQLADLAFHFVRGGEPARGVVHAISAAEHAMHSYAPAEAATHFQTALGLLEVDDPRRGAVLSGLGDASVLAGAEDDAVAAYETARSWFSSTPTGGSCRGACPAVGSSVPRARK